MGQMFSSAAPKPPPQPQQQQQQQQQQQLKQEPATPLTSSVAQAAAALPAPLQTARPSTPAERTRRQAGLIFGGAAFVLFSALITRRALVRRQRTLPSSIITPSPSGAAAAAPGATNPTTGTTTLSRGAPKSSDTAGYVAAEQAGAGHGAAAEGGAAEAGKRQQQQQAQEEAPDLGNSGPILAIEALTLATLNVFSWAVLMTGGALWALDIGNVEDLRRKVRGGLGVDGTGRDERSVEEDVEEWIAGVLARKERKDMVREEVAKEWRNERGRER